LDVLATPDTLDEIAVLMTVKNVRLTIGACLDSLGNQDYDGYVQIVVVDSNSTDGTLDYLRSRAIRDESLVVVEKESTQPEALMYALTSGLISAKYVALIDGDVVASRHWLTELLSSMRSGHKVAGGPCYTPKDANLLQRLIGYDLDLRFSKIPEGFVTRLPNMNMCIDRGFFLTVGFDTSFPLGYDMELGHRLRETNQNIWFNPKAEVWHHHRSSLPSFVRQQIYGSVQAVRVFARHPSAIRGDNINSIRMLVDAPLIALLFMSIILFPYATVFVATSSILMVLLAGSVLSKVVELLVVFRKPESLLCFGLYVIRAECWLIGLGKTALERRGESTQPKEDT
jgi:glycosyltransferase involved in cell wall biosynthesis